MDPHYEQRLRDEVIYLHSLWHQGPPRTTASTAAAHGHIAPTTKPQFKKKNPKIPKIPSSSTKESPCPSTPLKSPTTTWAKMPPSSSHPSPLTPEEITKLTSRTLHRNTYSLVRKFLITNNHSSSDDDDSDDDHGEDGEGDDGLMLDDDGREEYSFFFKVFKEGDELREYYEKHYVNGDFSCLVCGALGGKGTGKKFKGCLPLVQHSISIAKTKRKKAHRAFGQAVCKVLGWDVDRLPSVVSSLSGKSSEDVTVGGDSEKDKEMTMIENGGSLEVKKCELVADSGSVGAGVSSNDDSSNKVIAVGASEPVLVDNVNDNVGVEHDGGTALGNNLCILESKVAASGGGIHNLTLSNSDMDVQNLLKNSSACCPGGDNVEELNVVHPHGVETTVAERVTSIPPIGPNTDENMEELDAAFEYEAKEPSPEGLTIKLLTRHSDNADKNLEKTSGEEKATGTDDSVLEGNHDRPREGGETGPNGPDDPVRPGKLPQVL